MDTPETAWADQGGLTGEALSEYLVSFMIHLETITDREPDVVRHIRHDVFLGSVSPMPVARTIGDVGKLDGEVVFEGHIGVLHINVRGARDTFRDVSLLTRFNVTRSAAPIVRSGPGDVVTTRSLPLSGLPRSRSSYLSWRQLRR